MKIIITCKLGELWATTNQFATMSDKEIIELCQEDLLALVEDATWIVSRDDDERYRDEFGQEL